VRKKRDRDCKSLLLFQSKAERSSAGEHPRGKRAISTSLNTENVPITTGGEQSQRKRLLRVFLGSCLEQERVKKEGGGGGQQPTKRKRMDDRIFSQEGGVHH